jgi:hypothetical protein
MLPLPVTFGGVDIDMRNGRSTITAENKTFSEHGGGYTVRERRYGKFPNPTASARDRGAFKVFCTSSICCSLKFVLPNIVSALDVLNSRRPSRGQVKILTKCEHQHRFI